MAESQHEFLFQGNRELPRQTRERLMWCYFLLHGQVAGVEVLPLGLSDEDAIARAHILLSKRKGAFDGLEVCSARRFA